MDVHLQRRSAAAALERGRQERLDHRVDAGDTDDGAPAGGERAQPRFRLADLLEHALRMTQQDPARIGQFHAVARAVEQSGADAVLQPRQLLRQRRLSEAELLAGAGKRRRLRDGEEDAKLMQRHAGLS